MKLLSLLHRVELPADSWIFQGTRPERIRRAYEAFVNSALFIAILLLVLYWLGYWIITAAIPLNP